MGDEEGPMYSGGDIEDDPQYWTNSAGEALAYALFGSAIPKTGWDKLPGGKNMAIPSLVDGKIPMRETRPRVLMAPDPGYAEFGRALTRDPIGGETNFLDVDREVEAQPLPEEIMDMLIAGAIADVKAGGVVGASNATSARGRSPDEILPHLEGAYKRLYGKHPPPIPLPDEIKELVETSETDPLHLIYGEGWDDQ